MIICKSQRYLIVMSLMLVALFSGCTTSSNISQQSLLAKLKLSNVIVHYNVGADYQVAEIERAYIASKPETPALKRPFLPSTPGGQAFLRDGIKAHILPHIRRKLAPVLTGNNPVTAEIRITKVWVPGRLRGSLVGDDYYMDASILINDDVSGASVIEIDTFRAKTDDAIVLVGEKAPQSGISKRLSDIAANFSSLAVQKIVNKYSGPSTSY